LIDNDQKRNKSLFLTGISNDDKIKKDTEEALKELHKYVFMD